jgi:hypothetical protein
MKQNTLFLFFLIIIFSSCKKDTANASTTNYPSTILGKWHFSEQIYNSYVNNALTNHEDYTTTIDPLSYFEFDANGVFVENPQDQNGNFLNGNYRMVGDSLFVKRDVDMNETHYLIKTLTSSNLVLYQYNNELPYSGDLEYKMKH